MGSLHAMPLLLSILLGVLIGLLVWGFRHVRDQGTDDVQVGSQDGLLVALSALAAVTFGLFLIYLLLGLG
jgi:hypothetical protein